MVKKNYTKFSQHFNRNKEQNNTEIMDGQIAIDEIANGENPTIVNEEVESANKTYTGIVTGCKKLNVRKEPSSHSEVVCIIDENTEVILESLVLHNGFYKVNTVHGAEGYCMEKYIKIK